MEIQKIYDFYLQYRVICTDTRKIIKNSIFWALMGENFDGNDFVAKALESGASIAVSDSEKNKNITGCIYVENSLKTLQTLANFHRKKMNIPVIGITGTNGKTTTKELISTVLQQRYNTCFTKGNLNNHIGVPLSLLEITEETHIAVIEMGASNPGEIAELCEICIPDYGIITNVGSAHLLGFGNFETVLETKSALYRAVEKNNGTIFYNAENKILSGITGECKKIAYGNTDYSEVQYEIISSQSPFLNVKLSHRKKEFFINSKLVGNYNIENICAAFTIGTYFEISPVKIAEAISEYQPQNSRSQFVETEKNKIIIDAYNANPSSMYVSLQNFFSLPYTDKVLILGDMLELGEYSKQEHKKIFDFILENKFESVFLSGSEFENISKENTSKKPVSAFKTTELLEKHLQDNPISGKHILIKGSRGIKLEKVLHLL